MAAAAAAGKTTKILLPQITKLKQYKRVACQKSDSDLEENQHKTPVVEEEITEKTIV